MVFSTVFCYNFRIEVGNDVIFGVAVDNVSMAVPVKFGASRSSGFQEIRGADFVLDERTGPNSVKRLRGVLPTK